MGEFGQGIAGSLMLWSVSGVLSIALALLLAGGSLSGRRSARWLARVVVNVTRGIPTSLLVIAAGIAAMRLGRTPNLPVVFPGTPSAFQHLAWSIVIALALGSAGHLAEVFRASRAALGRWRLEEATVLGLSRLGRAGLLARECAAIALPPTGARLVHHLHNTAFAALFPVTDVFGYVQARSNETFRVLEFALLGCGVYVCLAALTWLLFRGLEAALVPPVARPRKRAVMAWS